MKQSKGYLFQLAPPCHATASVYLKDIPGCHPDNPAVQLSSETAVGTYDRCGSKWTIRGVHARIDDIYMDTYHWEPLAVNDR
jgi:hypothetical protein